MRAPEPSAAAGTSPLGRTHEASSCAALARSRGDRVDRGGPAADPRQEPESGPGFVLQGEGGLVTALLLDPDSPSTVYAATARGLYRSTDSGASWERRNRGLEGHSVLALAVDPSTHMLYAATDGAGVYKSADGGGVWAAANLGLTSRYVGVVAVQGGAVYAGTEAGRIFRSTDAAATWTELTPLTTRVAVTAIAVDPGDPRLLLAGTNSEGIYRSTDGGATWVHTAGQLSKGTIWSLAIDPTKSTTVYATAHAGLFRSEDSGVTWKGLHKSLKSWNVLALAIDPATQSAVRRDGHRDLQVARCRHSLGDAEPGSLRQRAVPRSARAIGAVRRNAPRRPEERGRGREVVAAAPRARSERSAARLGTGGGELAALATTSPTLFEECFPTPDPRLTAIEPCRARADRILTKPVDAPISSSVDSCCPGRALRRATCTLPIGRISSPRTVK